MTRIWREGLLASRRARLMAVLALASVAITVLALQAFDGSYYTTPGEFREEIDPEGKRWRIGGRVVDGTIVERNGRPVSFIIEDDEGQTQIAFDGSVPGLFGPRAFVVVEGVATGPGQLEASRVIIRHEPEFVTDEDDASIAAP